MRYFNICHSVSWPEYVRNAELSDRIYEDGMARVNRGSWAYVNPATGFGIFEDAGGNFLFMETVDEGAQTLIVQMHCGLNDRALSELSEFIDAFTADFDLTLSPMETND